MTDKDPSINTASSVADAKQPLEFLMMPTAHQAQSGQAPPFCRCWLTQLRRSFSRALLIACLALLPALFLYGYDQTQARHRALMPLTVPPDAFWIDARPTADFAREHVPGAINLNAENWNGALTAVFERWQPPRPIIVYCSPGCSAAAEAAAKLTGLGLEPVTVFEGGLDRWKQIKGSIQN